MANIRIELENENGDKNVFEKNKVKGRAVRTAFKTMQEVQKADENGDYTKQLDALISYVVSLFDNPKVTEDTLLDGLESEQLMSELMRVINDVIGVDDDSAGQGKK